jgi:hypothetical protein
MKLLDRLHNMNDDDLDLLRLEQDCPTAWAAMDQQATAEPGDGEPAGLPGTAFANSFDNWRDNW